MGLGFQPWWRDALRQATEVLREKYPPRRNGKMLKVRVSVRRLANKLGLCTEGQGGVSICIDHRANWTEALYVLSEEWAHAVVGPEEGHSVAWGRCYAQIIQTFEEAGFFERSAR